MTSGRKRVYWLIVLALVIATAWATAYPFLPLASPERPVEFTINEGGTLRSVARQLRDAGVLPDAWRFEALGRLRGKAHTVKAGSYQIDGQLSPFELLDAITGRGGRMDTVSLIEGWTFRQVRRALDSHPSLRHDTVGRSDHDVLAMIGATEEHPEGLFFPDKYFFVRGASDEAVLKRAYRRMNAELAEQWASRSRESPVQSAYEALILASIIEKETARSADRELVAAVFVNRLRVGMRLQADPTVIYGLGDAFDGDLRRRHLQTDGPYNSYTRAGLPPTPIAMPGKASIVAALNPARTRALYFVARGDGSSEFSDSLADHNRAVARYQRAAAIAGGAP